MLAPIADLPMFEMYAMLGVVVAVAGVIRLLLLTDLVARLVAMNVLGAGSLLILLALANRSTPTDPVLSALVITGLVITAAFTGVGAGLIRFIETAAEDDGDGNADDQDDGNDESDSDGTDPAARGEAR